MRERAEELGGVCAIEPAVGGGTCVSVRLPRAGERAADV
jgi:signal transduction histidine kinase